MNIVCIVIYLCILYLKCVYFDMKVKLKWNKVFYIERYRRKILEYFNSSIILLKYEKIGLVRVKKYFKYSGMEV